MGRRELREHVFKLLFMSQFNSTEEMEGQTGLYLENLQPLDEQDQTYIQEKYQKITEKLPEIDELINSVSKGWKTRRMSRVDLTILRLAVYELRQEESIPVSVSINEAVELGKRFGGETSSSFINGILGQIAKMER